MSDTTTQNGQPGAIPKTDPEYSIENNWTTLRGYLSEMAFGPDEDPIVRQAARDAISYMDELNSKRIKPIRDWLHNIAHSEEEGQ